MSPRVRDTVSAGVLDPTEHSDYLEPPSSPLVGNRRISIVFPVTNDTCLQNNVVFLAHSYALVRFLPFLVALCSAFPMPDVGVGAGSRADRCRT